MIMTINLYLKRKFVRDAESVPATNFYGAFRDWFSQQFPCLDDAVWSELLEEDENIDYSVTGNGRVEEQTVLEDGEVSAPENTD